MEKHSIAAYLEHIGAKLPAVGSGWRKIRCPFHPDKTASAGINFDEGRFKCHACGVAGDESTPNTHIKQRSIWQQGVCR